TQISTDGTNFNNSNTVALSNLTTGDVIADSVSFKLADSIGGYLRAKAVYSGSDEDSIVTAIALNSDLTTSTYASQTDGYKWVLKEDGYYYLVSYTDESKLLECANNEVYILFNGSIAVPDITKYQIENLSSTNMQVTNAILDKVTFSIVGEAVQSNELKTSSGEAVDSVSELQSLISENNIFEEKLVAGYIVKYETYGGIEVASTVLKTDNLSISTMPTINGLAVTWYTNSDLSGTGYASGTLASPITITENTTFYAKYPTSTDITLFFDANGGSGEVPQTQTITYSASGTASVSVANTLTKVGYELKGFKVKGTEDSTAFTITNNTIKVPCDITTAGKAVTLVAVWTAQNYTITFSSGDYVVSGENITGSNGTYTLNYTTDSAFTLPSLTSSEYEFLGWQVDEASSVNTIWENADILSAEESRIGYYGDVVLIPIWAIASLVKFEHTAVTKTYGDPTFINSLTNISNEIITYSSTSTNVATINSTTGEVTIVGVGSTTITATYNTNKTASYSLTVNKKDISSVTVTGYNAEYTYTGLEIVPNNLIVQDGNILKASDYTTSYANNIEIGTASITITATVNGNYTGTKRVYYEITKYNQNIVVTPAVNAVYSGSAIELVEITNVQGDVYYSLTTALNASNYLEVGSTTTPTATNVGTYTVYYYITGNNEYKAQAGSVVVTISAKSIAVPTASGSTYTYNGASQTYTPSNWASISTYCNISSNTRTNAGSQTVTITLKDTSNYVWSSGDVASKTLSFTINKASLTVTADSKTTTYGTVPTYSYSVTSGLKGSDTASVVTGTASYTVKNSSGTTITVTTTTGVGSYTIAVSGLSATNYAITYATGTLTINAKKLADPTSLSWNKGVASWGAVSNVSSYKV
ncbi:MAG: hypothetical protein IJW25_02235, partial [Clostridia bacterium]|nr:hypothetical protein [Clostridia bacterium]